MTRRTMVLFFLALLAASPLVWMSVDPNAGNKLLVLTSGAKMHAYSSNMTPLVAPAR